MDIFGRVQQLQLLVKAAGGDVEGRKKLHKLVYLCQLKGTDLGQEFVFYMYGVYSPSLAHDLRAAIQWGLLEEDPKEEDRTEDIPYLIHVRVPKKPDYIARGGDGSDWDIVWELRDESATMLEVLSTIVYLWECNYQGRKLHRKLQELKPHLKQHYSSAYRLAEQHFNIEVGEDHRDGPRP